MAQLSNLRPAVITVGNELTFGERRNANQEWLCQQLFDLGHPAEIVLSLPDEPEVISHWLRTLKQNGNDPIFVSGGIGGTHDDCTRESIALGLGVDLTRHAECYAILAKRYGDRFTDQRKRMADLPANCELIANPIGAPGFHIDRVFAYPGFPSMLEPMFTATVSELFEQRDRVEWKTLAFALAVAEGDIAMDIENFDNHHDGIHLGIYPSTERFSKEVTVRLRYPSESADAAREFSSLMDALAKRHEVPLITKD